MPSPDRSHKKSAYIWFQTVRGCSNFAEHCSHRYMLHSKDSKKTGSHDRSLPITNNLTKTNILNQL